MSSWFL